MNSSTSTNDVWKTIAPPVTVHPSQRWVRVKCGGETIANSKNTLLLRQYGPNMLPTYVFPEADVRLDMLTPSVSDHADASKTFWNVTIGEHAAEDAAWTYRAPPDELAALTGYIGFDWHKMDGWYEEEQEIFEHARDPYHRVDILPSSRHVRVVIDGTTIAETNQPWLLFETSLPTRYYLPRNDVRLDLLEPTQLTTRCPYKGRASYWSARIGERVVKNIVWSYQEPIAENPKVKDLMCFFNERVDLYVDGELQPRPQTPWSK